MKFSIFQMFMALFGVALFVGGLVPTSEAAAVADLNTDNNVNDDGQSYEQQDVGVSYHKLITSLRLVDALIQNDIRELEQAQTEGHLYERGFFDQLLNRKSRYLNKRMKSVALGFGK